MSAPSSPPRAFQAPQSQSGKTNPKRIDIADGKCRYLGQADERSIKRASMPLPEGQHAAARGSACRCQRVSMPLPEGTEIVIRGSTEFQYHFIRSMVEMYGADTSFEVVARLSSTFQITARPPPEAAVYVQAEDTQPAIRKFWNWMEHVSEETYGPED
ncbi:hypothetical protein B0T26DRAFT_669422 [Lasiosphaeria miniovina]|uniref:Uncharacterized protein n=1 Tax=Lasiosphaeria miniovina TaxID=1954250 RepID=A0AA40BEU9_9PEZI|nr:uncharacterized protein B0T26DRAFT_669422 [Lasiosphaeria miniovina]KAK0732961.1 hypothetical protein B0T26DRAFT_669422 [Lasiosphaeria miniovina]